MSDDLIAVKPEIAAKALVNADRHRAMTEAAGGRTVSLEHVNAALRMAESDAPSGCVDAPGHVVERIGDRVVLKNGRSSTLRSGERDLFRYPLSIPGEVSVPQRGCIVSAQFAAARWAVRVPDQRFIAAFDHRRE